MAQNAKNARGSDPIDENLKRVFQETVSEDVPDRFKDLLAQLKAQDTSTSNGDKKPS